MVRLALAVACCVLAVGTAAEAQTTLVTGTEQSFVNNGDALTGKGVVNAGRGSGFANYASTISILPTAVNPVTVSFESGNAVTGPSIQAESNTFVNLALVNNGNSAVTPVLHSQITAAGMGFYMADTRTCASSEGGPSSCMQSQGFATLSDLRGAANSTLAGVDFDFSIVANDQILYSVHGGMTLTTNSDGFVTLNTDLADARAKLAGFTDVRLGNAGSALGYAWDATNVPQFSLAGIPAGENEYINYQVSVSTFSRGACLADGFTCLIAYSSFGDPIGRGGGIESADGAGLQATNLMASLNPFFGSEDGIRFINGVGLGPSTVTAPTVTFGGANGGVPEPATWTSMILGFGLLGAALRRRRVLAYT